MVYFHEPLFQPSALQNLKLYRYSAVDKSPLTKYVLRHYWDFAVTLFPMSMAPNLITLSGLGFIIFNVITLIALVPNLVGPAPSWVYYSFALGLFLYQTFDNVDGRQARRTKSSSALGHIFDHTIDSLNTPLGGIILVASIGLGHSLNGFFITMIGLWPMWLSTWEEYYTGTLYLGYINGPTEGILIVCCVQVISGFFGPAVWKVPVSSMVSIRGVPSNFQVADFFQCFVLFTVVFLHTPACLYNVYAASKEKTFSFRTALMQNIPFILYNLSAMSWLLSPHSNLISGSNTGDANKAGGLIEFALLMTSTFGKLGPRVILAHLTKSPFPWFNVGAFGPLIGGAILVNLPSLGIKCSLPGLEIWYLRLATIYASLDFIVWFMMLCRRFMTTLDIDCLTIKTRKA
ncbi:Choline/ethanolaminephosphotransferase [Ramaria rubella]|nr:Choline/ethanolaminephosphotransferase [Ramaria rubella]